MTWALLLSLLAPAFQTVGGTGPPPPLSGEPRVRLRLSPGSVVSHGERVRVTVETKVDGFLTVLRIDAGGRPHVLFPAHPSDEQFVRAGRLTEAFVAYDRGGDGTILAALSQTRFDYATFTRNGRWVRPLTRIRYASPDHVRSLLHLAEHMAGERVEYHVVNYWTSSRHRGSLSTGARSFGSCTWAAGCPGLATRGARPKPER